MIRNVIEVRISHEQNPETITSRLENPPDANENLLFLLGKLNQEIQEFLEITEGMRDKIEVQETAVKELHSQITEKSKFQQQLELENEKLKIMLSNQKEQSKQSLPTSDFDKVVGLLKEQTELAMRSQKQLEVEKESFFNQIKNLCTRIGGLEKENEQLKIKLKDSIVHIQEQSKELAEMNHKYEKKCQMSKTENQELKSRLSSLQTEVEQLSVERRSRLVVPLDPLTLSTIEQNSNDHRLTSLPSQSSSREELLKKQLTEKQAEIQRLTEQNNILLADLNSQYKKQHILQECRGSRQPPGSTSSSILNTPTSGKENSTANSNTHHSSLNISQMKQSHHHATSNIMDESNLKQMLNAFDNRLNSMHTRLKLS